MYLYKAIISSVILGHIACELPVAVFSAGFSSSMVSSPFSSAVGGSSAGFTSSAKGTIQMQDLLHINRKSNHNNYEKTI